MAILALIRDPSEIPLVIPWAHALARTRSASVEIACWNVGPNADVADSPQVQDLEKQCKDFDSQYAMGGASRVTTIQGESPVSTVMRYIRTHSVGLVVAAQDEPFRAKSITYAGSPLLKQSPCLILLLSRGAERSVEPRRVMVAATDNAHDTVSLALAKGLAEQHGAWVTLAREESDLGSGGAALGRRELLDLAFESGIDSEDWIDYQVFETGDHAAFYRAAEEHDLVLVGANSTLSARLIRSTHHPCVAVVKGSPPIRSLRFKDRKLSLIPSLSPADYADLIQGLRKGSRLSADFIIMLFLATVVASIGLLQDSPAVVIGSMLLAPLMTPMIGCGLAISQANIRLGRTALATVAAGLLMTLTTSLMIGWVTPGNELTPQIYSRGDPTVLDLFVAIASAAAAAYALARPNLVGSIAGVAIATALVPPLCSVGLSAAYGDIGNAAGALLLFLTNFLAIVLSAAATFRLIGITSKRATLEQRRWVMRIAGIMGFATLLVMIPLHHALRDSLVVTKPQPRAYPLARVVLDALEDDVESHPEARLITAGLPSSPLSAADVIIVIGAPTPIPQSFSEELVETVRREMRDPSLVVEVHCVDEQWNEVFEPEPSAP